MGVTVGVGVLVGVLVGVDVGVPVGVPVGVTVLVGVLVGVTVLVGVFVGVGVGVGVILGATGFNNTTLLVLQYPVNVAQSTATLKNALCPGNSPEFAKTHIIGFCNLIFVVNESVVIPFWIESLLSSVKDKLIELYSSSVISVIVAANLPTNKPPVSPL